MNTMIEKHCTPTKMKLALVTFATVLAAACLVAVRPTVALAEELDDNFNNPAAAETVEEVAEDQEALPADEATVPTEEQATPQEGSDNLSYNATEETLETVPEPSLDEPAAQDAALDEQTTDDQASAGLENDTDESEVPSSSDEPSTSDSGVNDADVSEPAVASPTNTVEPASEKANTEATPQLTESEQVNQLAAELTSTVALAVQATSSVSKFVVVLDPGHGGDDSGAVGNGLCEKDLTLSIARYAKAQLEKLSGVVVYLTRDGDYKLGVTERDDIVNRIQFAVDKHADLFVSIHINDSGISGGPASGFEIYVQNSSAYRNNLHSEGVALANRIAANESALGLKAHGGTAVRTRNSTTSYPSPGGYEDYYGILRYSRKEGLLALIVENLFIDNASDASWLRSDANRKKLGIAIANAITEQYDLHQNLVRDEKGVRYIEDGATTYLKNAWKTVGNDTYYFGSDGYAVKYTQDLVGADGELHRYYFSGAGVMQTGFVTFKDGTRSYFDPAAGAALAGWQDIAKKTYFFKSDYRAARYSNRLTGRDGGLHDYYFNGLGEMFTGLLAFKDGTRSYFDPAAGNARGAALTGWQDVSGKTYHFSPSTLRAVRYSQRLTGRDGAKHDYYFSGAGVMQTGFVTFKDGTRSYFDPAAGAARGAALTGWQDIAKKTYYFSPSTLRAVRYTQDLVGADGELHRYYFSGAGVMQTGFVTFKDGTRSYFDPAAGAALAGWQDIAKKTYFFKSDYRAARYSNRLTGRDGGLHDYYFNGLGEMFTGLLAFKDGTRSYFDPAAGNARGAALTGWQDVSGKTYHFSPSTLRAVRYSQRLTGRDGAKHDYYFSGAGVMQTGWIKWNKDGSRSYYEPDKTLASYGAKYTGEHLIGSAVCTFDDDGILQSEVNQGEDIMGVSLTTVAQMVKHYTATVGAAAYPSSVYKEKGAVTINDFCKILFDEAVAEGVRAEVVYAQAMLETNYLRFGGDVSVAQCNFAGLGATGNGEQGNSFDNVREGLRAQVQHLKGYASTEPLNQACVDKRFEILVKSGLRGSAPTISGLTGKWAVSSAYGNSLKQILSSLLQTK
jgi:N-acetylmuramoyl-L-alanine amidase/glucan-binding YG repeat protein